MRIKRTTLPMKICGNPDCKKEFQPYIGKQIYCSKKCCDIMQARFLHDKKVQMDPEFARTTRFCRNPDCNKEFTPTARKQMFCCEKCSQHIRNRVYREQAKAKREFSGRLHISSKSVELVPVEKLAQHVCRNTCAGYEVALDATPDHAGGYEQGKFFGLEMADQMLRMQSFAPGTVLKNTKTGAVLVVHYREELPSPIGMR